MKIHSILLIFVFFASSGAIQNYMGTEIQKCLNCLCHARSGCFSRYNCAKYSISKEYWTQAQSPTVDIDDDPNDDASYTKCMKNENCILATIVQYADVIGHMDCNCDGKFDCKDRLAIHLFGANCSNPKFGSAYATRFNRCAKDLGVDVMLRAEGYDGCVAQPEPDAQ